MLRIALGCAAVTLAAAIVPTAPQARPERPKAPPTYAEHVAPILNRACVECHRPGEVAPFSLIGFENAKKWAPMIALVIEQKRMPPWKAAPDFGSFQHEMRLSDAEIATLKQWQEGGTPRGDRRKEPKPPTFGSEWTLGEPDLVLQPTKEFKLEAEGGDVYRNFVLKSDHKEPIWVRAMDVRPGNKRVVHHVIAFLDASGEAKRKEARTQDGQEGYTTFGGPGFLPSGSLGGWAPGLRPIETPKGIAFKVNPGETIVMQVHYSKSGKPETDRTKLGLYLAKEPIEKEMKLAWLANPFFRLEPGKKDNRVVLSNPIPSDVHVHWVMPHMHLLGRSMKAEAVRPGGQKEPLIWIRDWDFNWQLSYAFKEPIFLPKGSRINIEAIYDNSAENPRNPSNPPRVVTWGEETRDEMMLFIAAYTLAGPEGRPFGIIR